MDLSFFRFPNIILEINTHSKEVTTEEEAVPSPPIVEIDVNCPLDFSNAPAKRLRESEEHDHEHPLCLCLKPPRSVLPDGKICSIA